MFRVAKVGTGNERLGVTFPGFRGEGRQNITNEILTMLINLG